MYNTFTVSLFCVNGCLLQRKTQKVRSTHEHIHLIIQGEIIKISLCTLYSASLYRKISAWVSFGSGTFKKAIFFKAKTESRESSTCSN